MSGTTEQMEQGPSNNSSANIKSRTYGPCTWNNYQEEHVTWLEEWCKTKAVEWYINREIGERGTPHLQFCFKTKNPLSFNSIKNQLPGVHIEITKNWKATVLYCTKKDTAEGPNINSIKKLKDPMELFEPHDWQQTIIEMINIEPDNRTINWIVDPTGNSGKTSLAKHLCINHPGNILYMSGKSSDIKYGVFKFTSNPKNNLKMCIFDFPRTVENYISYDGIESIKNGIFYNTKYESEMCIFDPPHIVIFANFEPEYNKLSLDRWNVINI